MQTTWTLPGTTLVVKKADAPGTGTLFQSLFLTGGLTLSQVSTITGLEPYTVQNWVKRRLLPPPQHKRYDLDQLCRIININMLKNALPMERICGLLGYINGRLDDESDDIIDSSQLYFIFVNLAAKLGQLQSYADQENAISETLADYQEPVAGAKERIRTALRIMLTAWVAASLRQKAEELLAEIGQ